MPKQKGINKKYLYILGGITLVLLIIAGYSLYALSPYADTTTTTTTPTTDASTIALVSRADREDVSNFVEIDIWVPKATAEFDEEADIFALATNFELLGTTKEADDISIDFTDYDYIWIEIDPDGTSVFSNDFHLITGGANYNYDFYVDHLASDVNFNMLDDTTMDEVSVSGFQTDGNYTVLFDVPHHTTSNIHANDDPKWAISEDDWTDMSISEKAVYYDEANFRDEGTLFDPTVASDNAKQNMDLKFSSITEAFAFKMTFNDTIGTSTSVTGVNMTIDDDKINGNAYRLDDGIYSYIVFDSPITFTSGVQELGLEIEFGANITLSNMHSGRLTIPSHLWDTAGLSFSALSAIGA